MQAKASSRGLHLRPAIATITARYAQLDGELSEFYAKLCDYLDTGVARRIFPCQMSRIASFLAKVRAMARQVNQEPQVVAITGRGALVALNSLFFDRTVLEDEVFFCDRTLFVVSNQVAEGGASQASARVQVYSKGKMSVHSELQYDSVASMNRSLATELLVLECDKEFDGFFVEIGVHCPQLGRVKFATAPRVDAMTKELLLGLTQYQWNPLQHQWNPLQHHLCLMMHAFTPQAGNGSDTDWKASEFELNYVRSVAARSQLLLLCEHRRGMREEVAACVQRYQSPAIRACYYTQWQWDGLSTVQPELETLLSGQLHMRGTQLAKMAIKELSLPFKVIHQIKQSVTLSKSVAARQRRPSIEKSRDFDALRRLAASLGSKLKNMVDNKISEVSEAVAQHLKSEEARSRILQNVTGRAAEFKVCSEHKVEIMFLEIVSNEIREWNSRTKVLNKADELVQRARLDHFRDMCIEANSIPEIILVSSDMLNFTEYKSSSQNSRDSETAATICSFTDDMVRMRLRAGKLENFAAVIAAPLWMPLAAITMGIIALFMGAQRGHQNDEKFQTELRGLVQDFLDRLDASLIRTQLFDKVRERLYEDARRLKEFIEYYCILPVDNAIQANPRLNDESLMEHLVDLEEHLQALHGDLMMLQVEKLGCDVLTREMCRQLGVDMDADDFSQLGTEVSWDKRPVYLVSPTDSAQKPLVLKVASERRDSHSLLLEIDILRTVSAESHSSIIAWVGTVYFPKLHTIGFLTNKYDCDLWQFLKQYESRAVPNRHPLGSCERGAAFAVCRNTCDQIFAGVHQLHSKQILHRDLRLESVRVEIQRAHPETLRVVARLCDFGWAKREAEMSGRTLVARNGHMAPEVRSSKPLFSNKSDIYALGVIAWECFIGLRASEQPGALHAVKIRGNDLWDYLVQTMTCSTTAERPLIEQCRTLLRQFDKEPDGGNPLELRQTLTMPTIKDSLLALGSLSKSNYPLGFK